MLVPKRVLPFPLVIAAPHIISFEGWPMLYQLVLFLRDLGVLETIRVFIQLALLVAMVRIVFR